MIQAYSILYVVVAMDAIIEYACIIIIMSYRYISVRLCHAGDGSFATQWIMYHHSDMICMSQRNADRIYNMIDQLVYNDPTPLTANIGSFICTVKHCM